MSESPAGLRCAIYTRKSTEEGLEQEFNTLQAQRESAEAYIASQRLSGWSVVEERYDDGGFSGASLDRPALSRLMAAVEAGGIDCVVVYKVDRLSRSLLDFARLIAVFERHGVSFVSVTQDFSTTRSLGRLTLNILLSFAQFEREMIGERTRDKVSAARRKGKWTGGIPVLGYDVDAGGGRLVMNEEEAARVREIFSICAAHDTLASALEQVQARGFRTKDWTSRSGKHHVGVPFGKGSLRALLGNIIYTGRICHKGAEYEGEQPAIIERELSEQVRAKLDLSAGGGGRGKAHEKQTALLEGLLLCAQCRSPLVATYTTKQGRRHSYYVCPGARKGGGCSQRPMAAVDIEPTLMRWLEPMLGGPLSAVTLQQGVQCVECDSARRQISVVLQDGTRFAYQLAESTRGGARRRGEPEGVARRVPRISRLMALALKFERLIAEARVASYAELARAGQVSRARLSQILNLLNLAPGIQESLLFLPEIVAGKERVTEKRLRNIAQVVDWERQRALWRSLMGELDRSGGT